MKLLIASHNKGKIKEFKSILSNLGFDFLTLNDFQNIDEPEEDGLSLNENSLIKAKYYYDHFKLPVIADDTGLFIDDLNGEPGIKAARYSGFSDKENRKLVLQKLNGKESNAHFETVVTYFDGENVITANGILQGIITTKECGDNGFGYDSIFKLSGYDKTFAELSSDVKNSCSHRYIATCNLKRKLMFYQNPDYELQYIKDQFLTKLNTNVNAIDKIPGGMSNNTYLVKTDAGMFTARIPGINAELFVGRKIELDSLNKVKNINCFVQYNYFDLQSGFKVSPYIIKEKEEYDVKEIASVLDKLHHFDLFTNDFKPFERFLYYERLVNIFNVELDQDFYNLKKVIMSKREYLESRPKTPCHNDCQLSNHIFTNGHHVLIDFEFTGNNDPLFDFACLGNDDLNIGKESYSALVERELTKEENETIELWYSLQALSWYLVAMFKYVTGMNKTSGLDFSSIATYFLQKANNLLKNY